jgi:predicted acylesterase/phospholipase RssA
LALQGGGAPGAYQAGVFKSLYEKMKRNQNDDGNDNHLFDIIAVPISAIIPFVLWMNNIWHWIKKPYFDTWL